MSVLGFAWWRIDDRLASEEEASLNGSSIRWTSRNGRTEKDKDNGEGEDSHER
jgi:hypothetical protein